MDYNLIDMIVNLGFAVAVATYLIYWTTRSLNGKLNDLKNSIEKLNNNIDKLIEVLRYESKR